MNKNKMSSVIYVNKLSISVNWHFVRANFEKKIGVCKF